MQLDVDVSPPANIMTFRLGITNVTFDLDPMVGKSLDLPSIALTHVTFDPEHDCNVAKV